MHRLDQLEERRISYSDTFDRNRYTSRSADQHL